MENIKLTPKRKEIVSLMNFDSIMSVLRYYPYRYEHYKLEKLSFSMHDKKITFQGKIVSKVKIDRIAKGRMKTSFIIDNGAQSLNVIMFNLKMFVINSQSPDSQTEYINFGGFLVGLLGIFIIVSLIILFGVASFVNSAISLILLLLIKNKTIKCKIIMGYNIIVLCLLSIPIITSLLS